jgi:hypothetical protein
MADNSNVMAHEARHQKSQRPLGVEQASSSLVNTRELLKGLEGIYLIVLCSIAT